MRMEEGLDTGAYCVCRTTRIEGKGAESFSDEVWRSWGRTRS